MTDSEKLGSANIARLWSETLAAHQAIYEETLRAQAAGEADPPAAPVSRETEPLGETATLPQHLSPEALEVPLPQALFERLETYARRILEANKSMNLVSRRDPAEQILNNLLDSLPLLLVWPQLPGAPIPVETPESDETSVSRETGPPCFILDAGSGSGVPGIPLRLGLDALSPKNGTPALLLVEARERKAYFLLRLLEELDIPRSEALRMRLESVELQKHLAKCDFPGSGLLCSRALGSVEQTFKWSRLIKGNIAAAVFIKGGPGLLRELDDDQGRWRRRSWQFLRHEQFHRSGRSVDLLTFLPRPK